MPYKISKHDLKVQHSLKPVTVLLMFISIQGGKICSILKYYDYPTLECLPNSRMIPQQHLDSQQQSDSQTAASLPNDSLIPQQQTDSPMIAWLTNSRKTSQQQLDSP